jgi:hypothetical protein
MRNATITRPDMGMVRPAAAPPAVVGDRAALYAIMRGDPDGWEETEPTEEDYDRHRRWAVDRFGQRVWARYAAGGWAPTPEV